MKFTYALTTLMMLVASTKGNEDTSICDEFDAQPRGLCVAYAQQQCDTVDSKSCTTIAERFEAITGEPLPQLRSEAPSMGPTIEPTPGPTDSPSEGPTTSAPSTYPTVGPTTSPSHEPTTSQPSTYPTTGPTASPSAKPSSGPSSGPTEGVKTCPCWDTPILPPDLTTTGNYLLYTDDGGKTASVSFIDNTGFIDQAARSGVAGFPDFCSVGFDTINNLDQPGADFQPCVDQLTEIVEDSCDAIGEFECNENIITGCDAGFFCSGDC